METAALLIEIGCEEIPPRMIRSAAEELRKLLLRILDQAGLEHGSATAWGGPRRLAVRVEDVASRQSDREELVLGPPADVAFNDDGQPTRAAIGFATKQQIDPAQLKPVEIDKGRYAGFRRSVTGKTLGEVLSESLPAAVKGMSFPKTMRWGDGRPRWVRPLHWLLALHGRQRLPLELFGVAAQAGSVGHRFRSDGAVRVKHPDDYARALEKAWVVVEPAERRRRLSAALHEAAAAAGGTLVEDAALLEEVADLVEWPGMVQGSFDPAFLKLPLELLVTTLRHHQKCFSVQAPSGDLLPVFLAAANTDRDPGGHIRRGNEWVVGGRLEDARFFWNEDRKQPLAERSDKLNGVVFHARLGTYADKAGRMERLAGGIAERLGLEPPVIEFCRSAAALAKNDLVSGTVGEFPELQGKVGGLLLAAEGQPEEISGAVYAHYQPHGSDDPLPPTPTGCVVSVADKLDSLSALIGVGEQATGSRDPFGLRRASNGIFRVVIERQWPLSLNDLAELAETDERPLSFLAERLQNYFKERGWAANEVQAAFRPRIDDAEARGWPLHDILSRLEALRTVRDRADFAHLVDLTKRVDNILVKGSEIIDMALKQVGDEGYASFTESKTAALALDEMIDRCSGEINQLATEKRYAEVIDALASFVDPVERFFVDVLVLDPDNPNATLARRELLAKLKGVLTRCFDIRELAGQAERRE